MSAPPLLHVLYEDNHCLALAKPAGLLTQGVPPGIPTLEAQAKAYLKERYRKAGNVYLGIPHRLDRPVSGVVLFARSSKAAQRLADQFREHQVTKVYWGLVAARPDPEQDTWQDWIRKVKEQARAEAAEPDAPGARRAVLSYRLRGERSDPRSAVFLLEFQPQTGRMHQIRLQAALHGLPILGDELYGSTAAFGPPAELARDRVIALHARSLTFLHPIRYEPVTVTAPVPDYWPELAGG